VHSLFIGYLFFIFSLRLLGTSDGVKIVPFACAFVAMLKISTSATSMDLESSF
jgi:hypothetical protein